MKKLISTLSLCIISLTMYGQGCYFWEDMEVIDSISSNNLASSGLPGWNANTVYFNSAVQSYHGTYGVNDSAIATTTDIDLTGNTYVILSFWHICKLQFFDEGIIEVSNDGGNTWIKLTGTEYLGGTSSNFIAQGNKFTEAAYPVWFPGLDTMVPPANQSAWWQYEQFDISALVGGVPNAKVRFVAHDLNSDGMNRYGWLIDDICVVAAPCELIPPTVHQAPPPLQGTVYSLGPYDLNVYANDASGLAAVYLYYTVNGVGPNVLPMVSPTNDSLYTAQIPAVNNGDTICYFFYVQDASGCGNETYYPQPPGSYICFTASSGITFPYCDNFDVNDLWVDSTVTGSPWELGTPNFGLTSSSHSPPNAWDISLNSGYVANSKSYLISPVLDFLLASNVRMSFWYNSATTANADGVRLEYSSLGGPWQTLTTASDPSSVNWYNIVNVTSSGQPGWGGNSNGWQQAKFNLSSFNFSGPLQFRFVFTSGNFSTGDGFTIDDFCVIQPPPEDVGVDKINEPFLVGGAGQTSNAIVRVRNFGTTTQSAFDVYYSINSGPPVGPVAYGGPPLAPNDTAIITMPTFTIPSLQYDFCAWTSLSSDADNTNDTLCIQPTGIPVDTLSYCNNFDVLGTDWTGIPSPQGNTLWELGTPNYGSTNTAFSNPNSWDINLNTAYDNNAFAVLLSPFFDFSNVSNVDLSFWRNNNTETAWDGVHIDYSLNASPWAELGGIQPGWYTNTIISNNNNPAFAGTTNGTWVKSYYNMSQFNNTGLVQLRFVFTSDASVTYDGFSIDNFCLHVPQPIDVGVDSILSPGATSGAGQNVDVNVRVRNFGSLPISAFDVYYDYNSVTYGPFSYTGPSLAPNSTTLITIPPQIAVPVGVFSICAYTSLSTDLDHTNDTTCGTFKGIPVLPLTYCNNFDSSASDWTSIPSPQGNTVWEWGTPNYGVTTGAYSPLNAWDINLNTAYNNNANAVLLSPYFDFTLASNVVLTFWRNNNTETAWDGVHVDYSQNYGPWIQLGGIQPGWYTNTIVSNNNNPAFAGNTNGIWTQCYYPMDQFNNIGLVQLRFVFTSDGSVTYDGFSIDDLCLRNPPPYDAGVISIDAPVPQGLAVGTAYNLDVTIRNFGQNIISNFPVVYSFNGGNFSTIFTGSIAPSFSATQTITLPTPFVPISGAFNICAWTELPNDGDATNDTTCRTFVGVPTLTPTYTDNFDGPNIGWSTSSANPGTIWELGTPNFGFTSSAYSPPNSWDINLNSGYNANANAQLISPYFDFTNVVKGELSFYMNYKVDNFNGDGMHVDYSLDGGTTWNLLGAVASANSINWYNANNIASSATPGWNGTAPWQLSKYVDNNGDLDGQPSVRFRFVFTSDGFTNSDGVSIDDIKVYRPIPNTAATLDVKPTFGILQPGLQSLNGLIQNTGYLLLNNVAVTLQVDGTIICTDTINPTPTPGGVPFDSTFWHTFSCLWNASPGAHNVCIWTSYPNQTIDEFPDDDTTCVVLTVFDTISVFPYCTDFESGPQWVTLNSIDFTQTSSWELGNPSKTNFNGAYNGTHAWVTKLTTEYPNLDESSLFTPVFNVNIGKCYEVSFYQNFDMDLFNDGGSIEYSIDSAKHWKVLGSVGDVLNWYNSNYIAAYGAPIHAGFTGFNGGWIQSAHNFQATATGTVIFRFRFTSDQTNNADGWEIDQFCFKEITGNCITEVEEPSDNSLYLYQNVPNPVNDKAVIAFNLPKTGMAQLTITNLVGQVLSVPVSGTLSSGRHTIDVNSKDFAAGVYYYTLEFNGKKITRKMVITP